MLIVCPSCASEYQIDLDRVGPEGRSVRCAACRETWFISPDEVSAALEAEMTAAMMAASEAGPDAAESRASAQAELDAWEAALAAEPDPSPPAEEPPPPVAKARARPARPTPAKPKRRGFALASPGAALGLAVVAGLCLAVLGRASVVRAMPQSAGLYARLGLPVNLRGLDLRDVVAFQTPGEGAQGQLVVEGDLVGVAAAGAEVPPIEVEVRDGRDQPLYRWRIAPPRASLERSETARFRASLSAPPAQGRSVRVHFAAAEADATLAKDDASPRRP
ncbi:zinc-ribbon domain-containing protein [Methylobacterium sp. J-068]|uniref:zinc-ribbon domain-containing protein n=1 Tax=Methylobacterium sp. J-068 TaxID=2836649 RepID=UPI001FBBA4C7|nr:zinc-ribbon domain-containing protein [Methylobacterium sp. J-068]MCJ2034099.1 zinc-ribbon domain-containing protein [Methylobacterium sp. J-068]